MKYFFLLFLGCTALAACNGSKKMAGNGNSECSPEVMCTMMFATISVNITDNAGNAVSLDSSYTVAKSSGRRVTTGESFPDQGNYVVIDDSYVKVLQNRKEEFIFTGYKNGRKVVEEPYTVGADCCHVSRISGKEKIMLP